jgi:hypothetical protein
MELKSGLTRSGSWEKAIVTVFPPEGNGIAALPFGAQAVVGVGPAGAVVGAGGCVAVGAGAWVGVAAGPQEASNMLAKAKAARIRKKERFTVFSS